jgi:hypothetical protein
VSEGVAEEVAVVRTCLWCCLSECMSSLSMRQGWQSLTLTAVEGAKHCMHTRSRRSGGDCLARGCATSGGEEKRCWPAERGSEAVRERPRGVEETRSKGVLSTSWPRSCSTLSALLMGSE